MLWVPRWPQNVVQADALCTLSAIEEANTRVEELLSEESRERHSVSGGQQQLLRFFPLRCGCSAIRATEACKCCCAASGGQQAVAVRVYL